MMDMSAVLIPGQSPTIGGPGGSIYDPHAPQKLGRIRSLQPKIGAL